MGTPGMGGQSRVGRVLSLLAALLAIGLIVHALWNAVEGRRLNRTIRGQTAAGLPMSLRAVLPEPVPDQRNAAVPMAAAFSVIAGQSPGNEETPEAVRRMLYVRLDGAGAGPEGAREVGALSEDEREALAARLAEPDLKSVFQLLTAAAEGVPAQFPVDYEAGLPALTPHHRPLRTAHHLLMLRAWLASEAGEVDAALRDLRTALHLTRGLSKEPLIASHQTRITCDRQTVRVLRQLLDRHPRAGIDTALLWSLTGSLTEARGAGVPGIVRALDGERVIFGGWLFLSLLSRERRGDNLRSLPRTGWTRLYATYFGRPLLKADARAYLLRMEAYRRAAESGNVRALQTLTDNPLPHHYPLTRAIEPTVAALWRSTVLWLTDLQLADVAVRVLIHAQVHSGTPASLGVLEHTRNGVSLDPLGQPLVYTRTADGFRLFSYGFAGPDAEVPPDELVWEIGGQGD